MDLKLTFDDGSEAYLAHYGIKGMKWKNHVAKKDEGPTKKQYASMVKALRKSVGESAKGAKAKKAKAKVKAHFAKRHTRKYTRARGVVLEDTGGGKIQETRYR